MGNLYQDQVKELQSRIVGLERVNAELMRRIKDLEKTQATQSNPFPVLLDKNNFHQLKIFTKNAQVKL